MEKIKDIIIGTNNEGKFREISELLPKKINKYSPKELNILSPIENGKTFEENSKIKASFFSKKTNLVCLADDSGLEIDLLNGMPGVYSSRWGGSKKNFDKAIEKVFREMRKVKKNWLGTNHARFICCLTIFWPNNTSFSAHGVIEGNISDKKKGNKGFGYDPIFIPKGYNKTFGQLSMKVKNSIDHRFKAFTKIKKFF
jgi:XTP/dITP diphosphohydrolase